MMSVKISTQGHLWLADIGYSGKPGQDSFLWQLALLRPRLIQDEDSVGFLVPTKGALYSTSETGRPHRTWS